MIGVTVFVGACAKEGTNGPDKQPDKQNIEKPEQSKGVEKANDGLVNAIKNGKLANFQSTTIGNAFDAYRYLTKKEWKAEQQKSGPFTVDFIGWFEPGSLNDKDVKDGITARGLEVKFVVEPNGSFYVFMVSMLEIKSDGKAYRNQLTDSAGILANIYANKKIIF